MWEYYSNETSVYAKNVDLSREIKEIVVFQASHKKFPLFNKPYLMVLFVKSIQNISLQKVVVYFKQFF